MKKINLLAGLVLIVLFLGTGYYMMGFFKPQHLEDLTMRMQIRASHIYILFIALLNILSFKCDLTLEHTISRYLDFSFRTLLLISGLLAIFGFIYEHSGDLSERTVTLFSVVSSLASVTLMLFNELLVSVAKRTK